MGSASEYEKRRLENIKKNEEILLKLGLNAVTTCREVKRSVPCAITVVSKSVAKGQTNGMESYLPKRRSSRNREAKNGKLENKNDEIFESHEENCTVHMEEEEVDALLDLDTWCEMNHIQPGPWVDGHYHGWVNEEVRQTLGIAASASEAWESNGGGKFSYKNPYGHTDSKSTRKSKTRSTAKEWARKMIYKNPNAYFYRHTCPGEEQKQGEWSEEEIELFVQVAKTYGSGDKWGLFASHIPHRVGYQCSAAYREIVIPRGLIRDPNFKMTRNGKAIYVGKHSH